VASVLITGMSGSLSQLIAERLLDAGHSVVGVDYRPKNPSTRREIPFYRANYNKRLIEDIFKKHQPSHVLHLGRVGNLKTQAGKRFDLNVVGSAKIMELCLKYESKRLIVLSTFHIYGAHPANHIPISEEEPLRAAQNFPQLADAVQLDNQASTWVYRYRTLRTLVLRPCNIVGAHINNAISNYLRQKNLPCLLGYSPMWQFIDERDMVEALEKALFSDHVGLYNVAGLGELPLLEALGITGGRLWPIPSPIATMLLAAGGPFTMPTYFLDFLKYPCVVNDARFRSDFGFSPTIGIRESIEATTQGGF